MPTRSRKRFLASTEALLMLRAGARPSRWLQSCRRPWSASWGSCNSLHSNSICVGDTEDTQLPLLGRVGSSNGRQGPGEGTKHRAGRDATVGGAWRGRERKPRPRAPWEAGKQADAGVTSGQGQSHLAGTTFMKKLQVHWGLLQPLQPLGRQILCKGRQSPCDRSQTLLLEGTPRGGLPGG